MSIEPDDRTVHLHVDVVGLLKLHVQVWLKLAEAHEPLGYKKQRVRREDLQTFES